MKVLPTSSPKRPPAPRPARPSQFTPWAGDALDDRPTAPYTITERLPPTAPARTRPVAASRPAPASPPAGGLPRISAWQGVAVGLVVLLLLAVALTVGSALAR